MEDLKKRILESARKAGLENEMEVQGRVIKVRLHAPASARCMLTSLRQQRPAPPDIEWWDAPFLPEKTYDSYSPEFLDESGLITFYIQHPIQIPAPSDKIKVEPKALFLTKKELKKMRRQRRMADLKDRQDRVKMGLLAPDPPKSESIRFLISHFERLLILHRSQTVEYDASIDAGCNLRPDQDRSASQERDGGAIEWTPQNEF